MTEQHPPQPPRHDERYGMAQNAQQPPPGQPGFRPPPVSLHAPKKHRAWLPWVVALVAFFLGLGIGAAGNGTTEAPTASDDAAPQPTVTETVNVPGPTKTVPGPHVTITQGPPQAASVMTEDGVYLVGTDIKPGTYRGGVGQPDCYWARLSNTDGSLDGILANNNGGNQVVTIKKSDKAFETSNCGAWTKIR